MADSRGRFFDLFEIFYGQSSNLKPSRMTRMSFFFFKEKYRFDIFFRAKSTTVFHSTRAIQKIQKEVTGIHNSCILDPGNNTKFHYQASFWEGRGEKNCVLVRCSSLQFSQGREGYFVMACWEGDSACRKGYLLIKSYIKMTRRLLVIFM